MKYKKLTSLVLVVFLITLSCPVIALGNAEPNESYYLTIEDAYQLALKNSSSLKEKKIDIDRSKEVLDSAGDKVAYVPTGPASQAVAQAYIGVTMANIAQQMASKTKTIEEDIIYLKVITQYTKVLETLDKYDYAAQTLKSTQVKTSHSAVAYSAGYISEHQLKQANYGLTAAQTGFDNAKIQLQAAVTSFKDLLGIRDDVSIVLTDKPGFFPLGSKNVEAAASKALAESPVIWLAEQQASLKELELMLHDFTNPLADPYQAKVMDVEKAELGAVQQAEVLRNNIKTLHSQLTQLEEGYKLQTRELENAQDALRIKQIMYEIGTTTMTEVRDAELEVKRLTVALDSTTYKYETLKVMYDKPWLYAN
jgi:outer membrane protein